MEAAADLGPTGGSPAAAGWVADQDGVVIRRQLSGQSLRNSGRPRRVSTSARTWSGTVPPPPMKVGYDLSLFPFP
jgi:hypothetical protein